jgi:hypothetical protein
MKASVLIEPELEFGHSGRHIDPRFGLMAFGPADAEADASPGGISVGFVGDAAGIDGLRGWLVACHEAIAGKETHQSNLFPSFPGFSSEGPFAAEIKFDDRLERVLPPLELARLSKMDREAAIEEAVNLFIEQIESLAEAGRCDVILCARPPELHDELPVAERAPKEKGRKREAQANGQLDFHDLLKARAMRFRVPIQIVRPTTWDPSLARKKAHTPSQKRQVEDEASRAWNLHTALYYKAGGVPWRLRRKTTDLQTCFIGVSFFRSRDRRALHTSVAQVFNERGDGVIVRGEQATISTEDRQPHLSTEDSKSLLVDALARYRQEHRTIPARLVLHKSSRFDAAEVQGLQDAARAESLDGLELIWISGNDGGRLYRPGPNPPLRGTMLSFDGSHHLLYTRGSVPFYAAYPGMYVPQPIALRTQLVSRSPREVAAEVMALTKLNWNQTRLDGRAPITLRTARRVGGILRYLDPTDAVAARYSYYM